MVWHWQSSWLSMYHVLIHWQSRWSSMSDVTVTMTRLYLDVKRTHILRYTYSYISWYMPPPYTFYNALLLQKLLRVIHRSNRRSLTQVSSPIPWTLSILIPRCPGIKAGAITSEIASNYHVVWPTRSYFRPLLASAIVALWHTVNTLNVMLFLYSLSKNLNINSCIIPRV